MSFPPKLVTEYFSLRVKYAKIIFLELRNASGYLERIFFSDECIFHTNAIVSKRNSAFWGLKSLGCRICTSNVIEGYKYDLKCTRKVFCICFFCESVVNGENYKGMLCHHAIAKI